MQQEEIYYHDHGDGVMHAHVHTHPKAEDKDLSTNADPDAVVHTHVYVDENGVEHVHTHTHTQTKAVVNRLARAIGHLESVKRMVEDGRDCTEVLVQLAAVRSALNSTAKVILKDHMEHCVLDRWDDSAAQLKALNDAIDKFMG